MGYFCIRHPRADVISKECNTDVRLAGTAAGDCLAVRVFIANKRKEKEKGKRETEKEKEKELPQTQSAAASQQKHLSGPRSGPWGIFQWLLRE